MICGIDEHPQVVLGFGDVDDHQLLVHVDLAGGQAHAGRVVHGFGHVGHQLVEARRRIR